MKAAEGRCSRDLVACADEFEPEDGQSMAAAEHGQHARHWKQRHARVKQAMSGLNQQRGCRVLPGAMPALARHPEDAQHDQAEQQGSDGNMPGNLDL